MPRHPKRLRRWQRSGFAFRPLRGERFGLPGLGGCLMASYRFSATVVKRSAGRSATAAAAYRSGSEITCERYGETHDYTRKRGVVHAEIMAPEDAPEWTRDRAVLWNAVEVAEKRKDAQLAREIQLSLPHELTDRQRVELVRQFVADEFVSRGMVADLALHAPGRAGDDRNHHAHVMLTMRELDGPGFGKKAREWNDPANLERWREEWAHHQNREFERLGLPVRVDHRSFEAQGIDREPESHLGPAAHAMKKRGDDSRIVSENEATQQRNRQRTDRHVEHLKALARVAAERDKFETWAAEKRGQLDSAQFLSRLDLTREQERVSGAFEARLQETYGPHLKTIQYDADRLKDRLGAKGFRATFRRIWSGRADRDRLDKLTASIADAHVRMQEQRDRLAADHRTAQARLAGRQEDRRQQQHDGIERARQRKEETLAARLAEGDRQPAPEMPKRSLAERLRDLDQPQELGQDRPRSLAERLREADRGQDQTPAPARSLADRLADRTAEGRSESTEGTRQGNTQDRSYER